MHVSYNFEAARVGNAAFVAAFEAKFGRPIAAFRMSHARDPVPHLPPQGTHPLHSGLQVCLLNWEFSTECVMPMRTAGVPMLEYSHAGPEVAKLCHHFTPALLHQAALPLRCDLPLPLYPCL